jgi:hypothetical protein
MIHNTLGIKLKIEKKRTKIKTGGELQVLRILCFPTKWKPSSWLQKYKTHSISMGLFFSTYEILHPPH